MEELSKFTKGTLTEDVEKYTTQEILNLVWRNSANPMVPVEDCDKRQPREEDTDDEENENPEDVEELVDEDGKCLE